MSNKIAPSPSDKPPEEETAPAAEMSAAAALTLETATGTERTEAETAQPPSDDSDAESEDEDDGAPVRFSYANYRKAEIDLYDSVLQSVEKHLQYKLAGVVQFQDLLHTLEGYKRDGYKPEPGTVVEILDASMQWNLAVISNTYEAPDEGATAFADLLDNVLVFDAGEETEHTLQMREHDTYCCTAITQDTDRTGNLSHGNDPDEVRPARAAVMAVWGYAPFYWMQYQLVFAEQQMRFDRYHAFDFEEVQWTDWIEQRFEQYVNDKKKNPDFAAFYEETNKKNPGAAEALKRHIFEPFETMDAIINKWFDGFNDNVSCYMYLSFLGKDWMFVLLSLAIQIILPITLFSVTINDHRDTLEELCNAKGQEYKEDSQYFWEWGCKDHHTFLVPNFERERSLYANASFIGIVLFYLVKVVPDEIDTFISVASESTDPISRLNSLRRCVYLQDEDDLMQKFGYRLMIVMNSTYNTLLYLGNILVLWTYEDPWDIVLNALAIEFIKDVDESFTANRAYDEDYRFLKAGAIEMVIRKDLDLHDLDVVLQKKKADADLVEATKKGLSYLEYQKYQKMKARNEGENEDTLIAKSRKAGTTTSATPSKDEIGVSNRSNLLKSASTSVRAVVKMASRVDRQSSTASVLQEIETEKVPKAEIEEQAFALTQQPKKHFYSLYTTLKWVQIEVEQLKEKEALIKSKENEVKEIEKKIKNPDLEEDPKKGIENLKNQVKGLNEEIDEQKEVLRKLKGSRWGKIKRNVLYGIAVCANWLQFPLCLFSGEKAIFDRFGGYRKAHLKKNWEAIAFCKTKPDDMEKKPQSRPDLNWLTMKAAETRCERVTKVTRNKIEDPSVEFSGKRSKESSKESWQDVINEYTKEAKKNIPKWAEEEESPLKISFKREIELIESFKKKVQYQMRDIHPFFEDIREVLTFALMWKPLKRAVSTRDLKRVVFIVVAAILDWCFTLLEVLFTPIFMIMAAYLIYQK